MEKKETMSYLCINKFSKLMKAYKPTSQLLCNYLTKLKGKDTEPP